MGWAIPRSPGAGGRSRFEELQVLSICGFFLPEPWPTEIVRRPSRRLGPRSTLPGRGFEQSIAERAGWLLRDGPGSVRAASTVPNLLPGPAPSDSGAPGLYR